MQNSDIIEKSVQKSNIIAKSVQKSSKIAESIYRSDNIAECRKEQKLDKQHIRKEHQCKECTGKFKLSPIQDQL